MPGRVRHRRLRPLVAAVVLAAATGLIVAGPIAAAIKFPDASGPVVDDAHVLKPATRAALSQELGEDNRSTLAQLAVATVASTGDEPIEQYSLELFNRWRV